MQRRDFLKATAALAVAPLVPDVPINAAFHTRNMAAEMMEFLPTPIVVLPDVWGKIHALETSLFAQRSGMAEMLYGYASKRSAT